MGITFKNNFDEVLNKLERASKEASGQVSFDVLFNKKFMSKYTNFKSFDELLKAGGFEVNCQADFEAIPDDEFDAHISATTKFSTWGKMLSTAGEEHVASFFK